MVGQTDFSGRLIERKQPLLINFYESWHAQNTQKHDMARKWTRVLHAPTPEHTSCSRIEHKRNRTLATLSLLETTTSRGTLHACVRISACVHEQTKERWQKCTDCPNARRNSIPVHCTFGHTAEHSARLL